MGRAGGCFDFRTSRTKGEAGSSGLDGFVACSTRPLPFWESRSKAALVFPLIQHQIRESSYMPDSHPVFVMVRLSEDVSVSIFPQEQDY